MSVRRSLKFARIEEIMPEVDRLLSGHTTVGNWSVGQMCNHLSDTFRVSVEGADFKASWPFRVTLGKVLKRIVFSKGEMKAGFKLPDRFLPAAGLDARAEAEALRAAINYYLANPTPRAPHPYFGSMTGADWDRLHCIHSALHLSFALPD